MVIQFYFKRGTQYGILAVGFNKYGSFKELEASPIKHLLDVNRIFINHR